MDSKSGSKITDDEIKCNLANENWLISTIFSLKSVPLCVIDGKSSLV